MNAGKPTVWKKTGVTNLIRYVPSGIYYARARVGGKLFSKSLETPVFSVAKLRLGDLLKERRALSQTAEKLTAGRMSFGDAAKLYREQVDAKLNLKPRSKAYRKMTLDFILKSWPAVHDRDVRRITHRDCQEWLSAFAQKYASSVVNNSIGTLRGIFELVVEAGIRFDNPALRLKRLRLTQQRLDLPSSSEFARFVVEIASAGARQSRDCADFVRFLAFTGLRKTEAKYVAWKHIDFAQNEIIVVGDPVTGTKSNQVRHVPMIPEVKTMLKKMRKQRSGESEEMPVLRVNEAEKSMTRAARIVGISRMRHHDLRHLFASTCIEAGVDIPTVSRWLGHKDGGALAMRVYGHLRREHSNAQAQRVRFGSPSQPAGKVSGSDSVKE